MKKNKIINYVLPLVLVVSMSSVLFTGCKSKNNQDNSSNTNVAANGQGNRGNFDPSQRKQMIEDNIKSLVDDKTITQAQADKIVEALTANNMGFGGQRGQGGNQQGNNQGGQRSNRQNNQSGSQGNQPTAQPGNNQSDQPSAQSGNNQGNNQGNQPGNRQNGGQNRQGFNPLAQLVTDGVITQTQADAVLQKVMGNFGRPQNQNQNQSQPQNNQKSSGV